MEGMRYSEFARKVQFVPGGCWLWTGHTRKDGYGVVDERGKKYLAHRVSYLLLRGEIPTDTLDHVCRNKTCVNPHHLEAVSRGENVMRGETISARNAAKTHCVKGHPFDEENTRVSYFAGRAPRRSCRACDREGKREKRNA